MISSAQSASSAPTAAVLDSKKSTNVMANALQPAANTSVAIPTATVALPSNTAANTSANGTVATVSTASNGTQNVSVVNNSNTAASIAVVNANQSASDINNQGAEPLYGLYRVQSGDYLAKIADTHGTTVDTLRSINKITGTLIQIDQEILYPLPAN